ncbi:MAG: tetratricopeptide repeat protein [Planctomycetes bacterium]|nr:tetratricopeptide repeat protein [Planctomycetota bacterium]
MAAQPTAAGVSRAAEHKKPLRTRKVRNYSRWRAATLASVYLLFGLHIAHWKIAGKTLAPLELNEVMYTLELGIVTAGFLFMAVSCVATVIFGRFFCSWGCHILALEDLSAWILEKLGIRPRPIRMRLLMFVPAAALFYMFLWPQAERMLAGQPMPNFRMLTDADGWASFVTSDFWRNLPTPAMALLTFFVVGFAAIYVLGSRAFCVYGCPYGAIFRSLDRVAPGRITAVGECAHCGHCTAACTSDVRVHDELDKYGMVVNPACMRDLDCVAACPDGRIHYGFKRPPLLRSWFETRPLRKQWDFTITEEVITAVVFIATLLIFRGIYDAIPFLLTLGLGGITAYAAVTTLRLFRLKDVRLNVFWLRRDKRLTLAGQAFAVIIFAGTLFSAHCGFVRYHEYFGDRTFNELERAIGGGAGAHNAPAELIQRAGAHLNACADWGLFQPPRLQQRLARLHELRGEYPRAEAMLTRLAKVVPDDVSIGLALGRVVRAQGRVPQARAILDSVAAAVAVDPAGREVPLIRNTRVQVQMELGELIASQGDIEEALRRFNIAIAASPKFAPAHFNAGVMLAMLGRTDEASAQYGETLKLAPDDADAHNNLGFLLEQGGKLDEARGHFEHALRAAPKNANAHFNLGRLLLKTGQQAAGEEHLKTAASLDSRYAEVLRGGQP